MRSAKNHQPLQAATSGAYSHSAQDIRFTAHRTQSPGNDPVARFRSLREGYRPLLDDQGKHFTNYRQKTPEHDRYSNNKHIHAQLYPWGIQGMAHEDGRLAPWGSFQLQSEGYHQQWQKVGDPQSWDCINWYGAAGTPESRSRFRAPPRSEE